MSAAATAPPPATPRYIVERISRTVGGLYLIAIGLPNGRTINVIVPFSAVTLELVLLTAEVVGFLAETHDGATPALRAFQ